MATGEGNGNGLRTFGQALQATEAPKWVIILDAAAEARHKSTKREMKSLSRRVSALEQAVVIKASKSGAQAGRTWGTVAGMFLIGLFSVLNQCSEPSTLNKQPPTEQVK